MTAAFPRRLLPLATLVIATACGGSPPPPIEPAPVPPAAPPTAVAPAPVDRLVQKLQNGITAVVTEARPGRDAILQFGLQAGTTFVAPGCSELAAQVLLQAADSSAGRPSLASAIAALGGTIVVRSGAATTWFDLRVPGSRWREAVVALRAALTSPTSSRHQIERIRAEFVADRTAWVRRDPAMAQAHVLLLGDGSTAAWLAALLDRDPAEINLFQARLWQPERAVLAIEVPDPPAKALADVDAGGSVGLGGWQPPPAVPGPVTMLDRRFESGFYQAPGRDAPAKAGPCRVALVAALPGLTDAAAAPLLLLHGCWSLGGSGGRLEALQQEAGLAGIAWRSDVVTTSDHAAMVLTADVAQDQLGALWRTVQAARASLRNVPPNDSELALAARRLPLTARLVLGDDGARLRSATALAEAGVEMAAIDRAGEQLARARDRDLRAAADGFLALPFAMVVLGGEAPPEVTEVRTIDLLPPGHAGEPTTAERTQPLPAPGPPTTWPERAAAAIGSRADMVRLTGWRYEAKVNHEQAPALVETGEWRADGTLRRAREILGQTIETVLDGSKWSERTGTVTASLDAGQAAFARREQQRHPLALLAEALRGELTFRQIAQRDAGDRTVMVIEAVGARFDRLRLHIDTGSHLVRVVEAWETLPDGTVLHLHDAWSDYRSIDGLRVPFRRLTTYDDGQNRTETLFTSWRPELRAIDATR